MYVGKCFQCSLKSIPNLSHLFLMSFQHKLELMEVIWSYFIHSTRITSTSMYVIHWCIIRNNKTLGVIQKVKVYCYINFGISAMTCSAPLKTMRKLKYRKLPKIKVSKKEHKVQKCVYVIISLKWVGCMCLFVRICMCNSLNVYVPPKFLCWNPNPQKWRYTVLVGGPLGVIRSWRWNPHEWD